MPGKISRTTANYRDSKTERRCENCRSFEPPHGCAKVSGRVSPGGFCKFWTKPEQEQ